MNEEQRTLRQNNSLHLYFELLADALNDAGYEMKAVLAAKEIDVPWTKELIKETLWKPLQKAMIDKDSTTESNTKQYNEVYEVLSRHLAKNFGVSVPFPSNEPPMI